MKYTEEQLNSFAKPLSTTEEQRCKNIIDMVKDAIINYYSETKDYRLNINDYDIFLQGSYANNTNVKQNSDVDICIMFKNTFCYYIPDGYSLPSRYIDSKIDYYDLRELIRKALVLKFGNNRIEDRNKCIRILSNSYTTEADVVVAFEYRKYIDNLHYYEGIYFKSLEGDKIINYPQLHLKNGREKNNETNQIYKKMVRIFKKITLNMQEEKINFSKDIKGFILECMIYNIPSKSFFVYSEAKLSLNLEYMLDTFISTSMSSWKEVNKIKYLFEPSNNKNEQKYKDFMIAMKEYINGN